jgi:serine/threonine protein kinase/tetratricopeptide (TPR) repeat protein
MSQLDDLGLNGFETSLEDSAIREEPFHREGTLRLVDTETPGMPPTPAIPMLPPGYEELGILGRGGMGIVYKARDIRLNRIVALKMILAGAQASPADLERFRAEAEAVAQLQHPNIVQIFEVGTYLGLPFFTLEFIAGGTLAHRVSREPLEAREAAAFIEQLARVIAFAHAQGIVHRDLKPENVLLVASPVVTEFENESRIQSQPSEVATTGTTTEAPAAPRWIPKLTDFGLAKRIETPGTLTQSDAVIGTPSYMSPEQAQGKAEQIGPATDIFSLGALLYRLLTGRPPFLAASTHETLHQVIHSDPLPPRFLQPKTPRDLEVICLKCLQKDPARRYKSALSLARDLQRFVAGKPIRAKPIGLIERSCKWVRRNPALAGLLLVLFLGVVVSTVGFVTAYRESQRATAAEKDAKARLAQSYFGSARMAIDRGAWEEARKLYVLAEENGYPNRVELRLNQAKVLVALNQSEEALTLLNELSGDPEMGPLRGQIELFLGDLSFGIDDTRAAERIRWALQSGHLNPADHCYAQGLLASTPQKSLMFFLDAIRRNPFHLQARSMAGMTLVLLGRIEEANQLVEQSILFFPDQRDFLMLQAMIRVMREKPMDVPAVVSKILGDHFNESDCENVSGAFQKLLFIELLMQNLVLDTNGVREITNKNQILEALVRLPSENRPFTDLTRPQRNEKGELTRLPVIRIPFAVRPLLDALVMGEKLLGDIRSKLLWAMNPFRSPGVSDPLRELTREGALIDRFRELAESSEEASVTFFYANLLLLKYGTLTDGSPATRKLKVKLLQQARESYRQAALRQGIFNIHLQAIEGYLNSCLQLAIETNSIPNQEELQQALLQLQQELTREMLPSKHSYEVEVRLALVLRDAPLARFFLTRWEVASPTDTRLLPTKIEVASLSKDYYQVVQMCQTLFKNRPVSPALEEIYCEALARIEGIR